MKTVKDVLNEIDANWEEALGFDSICFPTGDGETCFVVTQVGDFNFSDYAEDDFEPKDFGDGWREIGRYYFLKNDTLFFITCRFF